MDAPLMSVHYLKPQCPASRVFNPIYIVMVGLLFVLLPLNTAIGLDDFLTRTPTGTFRITNVVEVSPRDGKILTKLVILLPGPQSNIYQDVRYVDMQGGEMVDIPDTREKHFRNTLTGSRLPLSGQIGEFGYEYDVTIYLVKANLEQITTIYPYDTGSEIYQLYTGQSGEYADPNNSDIQSMGDAIWSQSSDVLDYAKRCYVYVAEHFRYIGGTGLQPIATVIANGGGDCGNLSGLFVSLLRYKKIPARHIVGFRPTGNPHVWADFYMENYGWIPVDVTSKYFNPSGDFFGTNDGTHTVASRGVWFLMNRGDGLTFYTPLLQKSWWWWWWGTSGGEISARHYITSREIEPAQNLISNSGFETGTEPWDFYTNGTGNFCNNPSGAGSPRSGQIAIETPGTNVQLYQPGLTVESGVRYRLSFKAYSSSGHNMDVYLHKHGAPYTNYGLDWWDVDLGTSWNTYSREFTAEYFSGTVSDARLRFWPAPFAEAGDVYYFDDVVLERVDGGGPPPPIIVADQPKNPGFEDGMDPWMFYTNATGNCTNDAAGDGSPHAGHVTVDAAGSNVQLYQSELKLEAGERYSLSFKAYSNTGHDLGVYIHKHGSPYTNYGLDRHVVDVGTSWNTHTIEFTAVNFSGVAEDARLRFWLAPYAAAGDHYYFDDVALTKLGTSGPTLAGEQDAEQVLDTELCQNYPNPFNPSTTIEFALPQAGFVTLKVYNVLGEEVKTLVAGNHAAGTFKATWDATGMPSGVYFYQMTAGDYVSIKKMVLTK